MSARPIRIFVSYSHQNEEYLRRDSLLGFLSGLRHMGVEFWTDRAIPAGATWDQVIRDQISTADIALLLISQAFLDSEYVRNEEIRLLLERRQALGLVMVPILLSPCNWSEHPWLAELQLLPRDGKTLKEDFRDEGVLLRFYSQLRSELSDHVQRIRDARTADEARTIGERRWIATARCELRLLGEPDAMDPDEEVEAIHRCFGELEPLAGPIAQRFEGHMTLAAPEIVFHFGYPKAHEDDAYRAAMAGLELSREVASLAPEGNSGARFAMRACVDVGLTVVDPKGRIQTS